MSCSIVIASYGRPQEVRSLIAQIRSFSQDVEVIVVDQADTIRLSEEEKMLFNVSSLSLKSPHLPLARNVGWGASKGDIVLFFDDDVRLNAITIHAHISAYAESDILGVAGRVENVDEVTPADTNVSTGVSDRLLLGFTWRFWSTKAQDVQFPYGCNMSFRREVLEKIGGFDERFIPPLSAFEEVDLGLKVSRLGRIGFVPQAFVQHLKAPHGGTRIDEQSKRKSYWYCYGLFVRNNLSYFSLFLSSIRLFIRAGKEDFTYPSYLIHGIFRRKMSI